MKTKAFVLSDGSEVLVEVEPVLDQFGNPVAVGAGGEKQKQHFEKALSVVKPIANQLVETLAGLAKEPDEVAVEFGVKLSGEAGALIAKASTEANFKIALKWQKPRG